MLAESNHFAPAHISRREFINSLALLGAAQALPSGKPLSQQRALSAESTHHGRVIDVHHHILPPKYLDAAREAILRVSAIPGVVDWTLARSLEEMDNNGVRTSIVSISTPGIMLGSIEANRQLARECNEYAAKMVQDYPGRFGFFAAVPLPDREGSLREIEYALDTLRADGIGLMSSYDGKYLGDAVFASVFDELNRRRAAVYTHPTVANCCRDLVGGVHVSVEEFGFDTTRTISSLLYSGTLSRCPDIQFIFSHGGGALPFLSGRIVAGATKFAAGWPRSPEDELRRLYFDTASVTNPPAIAAILKLVPAVQLMFGTDYPWQAPGNCLRQLRSLGLGDRDLQEIEHDSAIRLFPRLRREISGG